MMNQFLENGEWHVSRNGGITQWGEWQAANSWSGHRPLSKDMTYRIEIYGINKNSSFGCKPARWASRLCFNGTCYHISSTHPSCKSVGDACYQADRFLTPDVFRKACERFYAHDLVRCVCKLENGEVNPYISSFGPVKWQRHYYCGQPDRLHPSGSYLIAELDRGGSVRYSQTNVSYWGYGGGGTEHRFDHWIPNC